MIAKFGVSQNFALHFTIALHLALAELCKCCHVPFIVRSAQTCPPFNGFTQLPPVSMFTINVDDCLCLCSCFPVITLCSYRFRPHWFCSPITRSFISFITLHLAVECGIHGQKNTNPANARMKNVVWITEGTSLVRCAVQHLRSLSESEKRFVQHRRHRSHQFPRRLPHSIFLDLTTLTDASDDAREEEITGWDPRSTRDPSNSSSF